MVKQTARLDGEEMSGGGIVEVTREDAVAIQKAALVMLMQAPPEKRLAHVSLPERYTVDHIRAVYQSLPEFDEESLRARGVITRAARLMMMKVVTSTGKPWQVARTLVDTWREANDWPGLVWSPQNLSDEPRWLTAWQDLEQRVAQVLSSRDAEVREVLEGLRNVNGCWCAVNIGHSESCIRTQALYTKLQPKERRSI